MRPYRLFCFVFLLACESRSPGTPPSPFEAYEDENVTVIGADEAGGDDITVSAPVDEGECVEVSDSLCVPVETSGEWCEREGGPVDLVIVDGEVVDVVCYPPPDNGGGPVEVIASTDGGDIEIPQNANRTAVTFDPATDGVPIEGDVTLDGNNVSFYGNGPDKTVIAGDVTLTGNNVRLRGLTITGNLYVGLNNAAVILCVIHGNVVFTSSSTNGSVFVENDVFGGFSCDSNNNLITGNDVAGEWSVTGHNGVCADNYAFSDSDADLVLAEVERGEALACPE